MKHLFSKICLAIALRMFIIFSVAKSAWKNISLLRDVFFCHVPYSSHIAIPSTNSNQFLRRNRLVSKYLELDFPPPTQNDNYYQFFRILPSFFPDGWFCVCIHTYDTILFR